MAPEWFRPEGVPVVEAPIPTEVPASPSAVETSDIGDAPFHYKVIAGIGSIGVSLGGFIAFMTLLKIGLPLSMNKQGETGGFQPGEAKIVFFGLAIVLAGFMNRLRSKVYNGILDYFDV